MKEALPQALGGLGPEGGLLGRAVTEAPEAIAAAAGRLGLTSERAAPLARELTARHLPQMAADADPYGTAFRLRAGQPPGFSGEPTQGLLPEGARAEPPMGQDWIGVTELPKGARLDPNVGGGPGPASVGEQMGRPFGYPQPGAVPAPQGVPGVPVRAMSPWERLATARKSPGVYSRANTSLDPSFETPQFTEIDFGKAASDLGYPSVEDAAGAIRGMSPEGIKALRGRMSLSDWRNASSAVINRMRPEDIAGLPRAVRDLVFGSRGSNARQLADDISSVHGWATGEGSGALPMPNLLGTSALGPASVVGAGAGGYAYGNPMPAYQGGTPYVPQTGPAMLHQGEMVLSQEQAEALRAMQNRPDWQLQMQTPFSSRAKGLSPSDFPQYKLDAQGRMQVPEAWDAPSGFSGRVVTPSGIELAYPGYMSERSDYMRQQGGPAMAQEIRRAMQPQGQDVPKTSQDYPRPTGYDEGTYQFILQNYGPRPAEAYRMHHYDSYFGQRGSR